MDSCFAPIGSHQHGIAWIQISPRLEWHSCQAYERTKPCTMRACVRYWQLYWPGPSEAGGVCTCVTCY